MRLDLYGYLTVDVCECPLLTGLNSTWTARPDGGVGWSFEGLSASTCSSAAEERQRWLSAVQASGKARVWDLSGLSLMMLATGCRIGECWLSAGMGSISTRRRWTRSPAPARLGQRGGARGLTIDSMILTVTQVGLLAAELEARGFLAGVGKFVLVVIIVLILGGALIGFSVARRFRRRR